MADKEPGLPTNYRQTRRRQERILLLLVVVVLVVGGTGLIGLLWGTWNAVQGFFCLLGGALIIGGLWGLLTLVQRWIEE